MTLIVEDGTIVANANSYISLAYARSYALSIGVTLSSDDAVLEGQLNRAMNYLESLRDRYQGYKTEPTVQELQWPRSYVRIDGTLIDGYFIPKELQKAQAQLAVEQENGIDIQPTAIASGIKVEKLGPLMTEYNVYKTGDPIQPEMTVVDAFLKPLLKITNSFSGMATHV